MAKVWNDHPQIVLNYAGKPAALDLIDQLRAFVATAQTGSFTGAAEQLGMSNRLTSKYVAELERRLGVRLFQRTTRKVGLTSAGEDLLSRTPALLDDLDAVLSAVSETSRGLSGTLRISAPVTFGEVYVVDMLSRFIAAHPGLTVDLRLDDRYVDLATEGIDVAFRLGRFDMASLKVRRLGAFRSVLIASPDYLARYGTPHRPEDLPDHTCIVDTNRRLPRRWLFHDAGSEIAVTVTGRFFVNSAKAAVTLAGRGFGLAYVPRFALGPALESGEVVAVLQDHVGESGQVGAVYLEGRALPRKVRALIDFAARDLSGRQIL